MGHAKNWKLRPTELRRMAAMTREAERERKMLALAEELEEIERSRGDRDSDPRN